jgi:3-hydroxy-3-methylglutaryl CoA synthase
MFSYDYYEDDRYDACSSREEAAFKHNLVYKENVPDFDQCINALYKIADALFSDRKVSDEEAESALEELFAQFKLNYNPEHYKYSCFHNSKEVKTIVI